MPVLFSIGLLCAIAVLGIVVGVFVRRRVADWPSHYRLLATLAAGGLFFLAVLFVCRWLKVSDFDWNQARLAPLFGLRYGYSLYYTAENGPVTGAIYGPISYLAYFPSLIAHTPLPALLIGSVTATLYYFAPVIWVFLSGQFRRREGRLIGLVLILIFGIWTIGNPALSYSGFDIHADAPALGLGAAACALLMRKNDSLGKRRFLYLFFSALLVVLAVYSKQSVIFLLPALACFVWIVDGRRSALFYAAALGFLMLAMFGVFATLFNAHALIFNLYGFPSHQGFGKGYMRFPNRDLSSAVAIILQTARRLWDYGDWVLILLALCYVVEFHLHSTKIVLYEWLRRNRWTVFHFAAIAGLPASILFGAKVGGDTNAFSLFLYFGAIGLLLFMGHLALEHSRLARPMVAACIILVVALIPAAMISIDVPTLIRDMHASHTERVYEYEKKHPGETYFAFFPLPTLMAERRLYHFEYGVFDRELGGARVSNTHFFRYVPPDAKYVQRYPQNSPIVEYLPDFTCKAAQPAFDGLVLYEKCDGSNDAAKKSYPSVALDFHR